MKVLTGSGNEHLWLESVPNACNIFSGLILMQAGVSEVRFTRLMGSVTIARITYIPQNCLFKRTLDVRIGQVTYIPSCPRYQRTQNEDAE